MANINIGVITFDSKGFCNRCKKYTILGTSIKISDFNDQEYIKLQQNNWRRSGQLFFHTNNDSCCQQQIFKILVNEYITSKQCQRSLRKYTTEQVKTKYSNLFQYTNKFRPSLETLQTKKAFQDYLNELSINLDSTQLNQKGFMHHSHDVLCSQVLALNQKFNMNVRVDKNNILHFKWPKQFINFLKKREQNRLEIINQICVYDQEAHNLFNQNYFEVNKQTYEKMFCDTQYQLIKYKLNQELVAVSYLEIRQDSLHRIAFHHNNTMKQINKISQDYEIKFARQQNLTHYYFVKIIQNLKQQSTYTTLTVDENFPISCGNKMVEIKNLKPTYKKYIFDLLTKLNQQMGSELFQLFEFKYN